MSWYEPLLVPLLRLGLWAFNSIRHPHLQGTIFLEGIRGDVEIIRDRWGVPHIFGKTIEDAVFAQGFVHAQERLWQMDFIRRVVSGRLSEVLGPKALDTDIAMRTLGLRKWSMLSEEMSKGIERQIMQAYCLGVNACMQREPLPVEFSLLRYTPEP